MRVALVCIARNEDNYLDEWIDYHTMLGVDDVFVYQNDWRFKPKREHRNLTLIEFDGECRQMHSYDDFTFNRSAPYDFGIFIDADEFVCVLDGKSGIKDVLANAASFRGPLAGVALNWRIYGDSGRDRVVDGDYSLLKRFTMCQGGLNPHVKTIVNFNAFRCAPPSVKPLFAFCCPHCLKIAMSRPFVRDAAMRDAVLGPFNDKADLGSALACINHYCSKTKQEFLENKCTKGRGDWPRDHVKQTIEPELFDMHNINEVECTVARDFYVSHGGL